MDIGLNKAFIFDFDGTLVDSEDAIYHCFQTITTKLAPERIEYAKKILIGPPLRDTASEILGPDNQDYLDDFVQLFIDMHDEQVVQYTQPYPGVIKILKKLYIKRVPLAIATNKRQAPTEKLINHFGWNDYFKFVECSNSQSNIRDKISMIKKIIINDKSFKNAYFVGDTLNDYISATKNKLLFIKASYGYGQGQDWEKMKVFKSIQYPDEILNLI